MTNVFQFGSVQVVNDMIFGWCARAANTDGFVSILDLPTITLEELAKASFPVWLPETFQSSIRAELQRREVKLQRAKELGEAVQGAWMKYEGQVMALDQRVKDAERKANRLNDRVKLMTQIMEKMIVVDTALQADIDYLYLCRRDVVWRVIPKAAHLKESSFDDLESAIDFILAKWW